LLEWIVLGVALAGAGAAFFWWLLSADSEIKRGVDRARKRHFHETGGGWTRLPWEDRNSREPDREDLK
jgi:hypothetical protein